MDDDLRTVQDAVPFLLQQTLPPKHRWNSLENYLLLHETRPLQSGFVVSINLDWTDAVALPGCPGLFIISCEGTLTCRRSVRIRISKTVLVRAQGKGRRRVRTVRYSYHAYFSNGSPILRNDNAHVLTEHHQHRFNLQTGEEISNTLCEWPLMHEFIEEAREFVESE